MSRAADPAELYTLLERVGKGSFGEVYRAIDRRTNLAVAVKIINLEAAEDEIDDIQSEIAILSQLDCPNVTRYHGSFLRRSELWIVMEFCSGGSCSGLLQPGPLEENFIAIICRELLTGLAYLHAEGKLHRDIKAANVLLTSSGEVKLADFGVSGQLTSGMTKKNTFVGTPYWMSPEVIKQSGYNSSADIWSLGITAIELALGGRPYSDLHPMKVLFLIPKNPSPTLPEKGNFSKAFRDFLSLTLARDPLKRPSAKELLKHKFIKSAKKISVLTDLIERRERWKRSEGGRQDDNAITKRLDDTMINANDVMWDFGSVKRAIPTSSQMYGKENKPARAPHTPGNTTGLGARKVVMPSADSLRGTLNLRKKVLSQSKVEEPFDFEDKHESTAALPHSHKETYPHTDSTIAKDLHDAISQHLPVPQTYPEASSENEHTSKHSEESERAITEQAVAEARIMLDVVVQPVLNGLCERVGSGEGRDLIERVRHALEDAENIIPGFVQTFISDVVSNCDVEQEASVSCD